MASPATTNPDSTVQKRKPLRKGTHSCTECRRRKIKCVYPPNSPNLCAECYARSSECITQEHDDCPVFPRQRKNLRERVSRTENILESILKELDENKKALQRLRGSKVAEDAGLASKWTCATDQRKRKAICLSESNSDAYDSNTSKIHQLSHSTLPFGSFSDNVRSQGCIWSGSLLEITSLSDREAKDLKVRQALTSVLPRGDKLRLALQDSGVHWASTQKRFRGPKMQFMSLESFASNAVTGGSPHDVAQVVLVLAPKADGTYFSQLLNVIDRLIISDDDYMGSLEGIYCALVQGNLCAQAGQVQRAFKIWRRAIVSAQMIGLHKDRKTPEADMLWWNLYCHDRFGSLMLGTPYAIADAHCNMNFRHISQETPTQSFIAQLCQLAGKVIDCVQNFDASSGPSVYELGRELTQLASEMPGDYWNTSISDPGDGDISKSMQWREQLLGQLVYHQVDIALHMPCILNSHGNFRHRHLGSHAVVAARKILAIYHILRQTPDHFSGKSSAVDSVGFTATVVLMLELLGYGMAESIPRHDGGEWGLVETSMEIFKRNANDTSDKEAYQNYCALQQLAQFGNRGIGTDQNVGMKFNVPFYGTVYISSADFFVDKISKSPVSTRHDLATSSINGPRFPMDSSVYRQQTHRTRPPLESLMMYDSQPTEDGVIGYSPFTNEPFGMQKIPNYEIDQDWNILIGDI